jgi:uncharacterized protein (DUF983 family)
MNKLIAIWTLKCPSCHKGDLFESPTFSFKKPFEMPEKCSNCSQNFMPEPGFYYGAMFISYIFMGWFCIGFAAVLHWVIGWNLTTSFMVLIAFCVLFFVFIFRIARSVWIHLMVKYKG